MAQFYLMTKAGSRRGERVSFNRPSAAGYECGVRRICAFPIGDLSSIELASNALLKAGNEGVSPREGRLSAHVALRSIDALSDRELGELEAYSQSFKKRRDEVPTWQFSQYCPL